MSEQAEQPGEIGPLAVITKAAEENERAALYACIGRLQNGWFMGQRGRLKPWWVKWGFEKNRQIREPMSAAEAEVMRVAGLKWAATPSGSSGGPDDR